MVTICHSLRSKFCFLPRQIAKPFHSQLEKGLRHCWVSLGYLLLANVANRLWTALWIKRWGEGKQKGREQDLAFQFWSSFVFPVGHQHRYSFCVQAGIHLARVSLFTSIQTAEVWTDWRIWGGRVDSEKQLFINSTDLARWCYNV